MGDISFDMKIDKRAHDFFQREFPEKLQEARKNMVEAAGKVWADEAKMITRNDNHIVTGLYVNSIGYNTGSPASEADVLHQLSESRNKTSLDIGSGVAYASALEKRYNIMGRALDSAESRMGKAAETQAKRTLFS
ncbi:hypothetical protein SAMN05421743_105218 [Thalassobacillus cyri]|uniref:Uncharacterized protein n=1 Tax=Thalassobacillus cyri TaxID=571932 RepID=A0A1H4C0D1_9BACI|nr:hypothetical protein [Thalassobacillus cyri]SEA53858.1 hypothetical protein SAMN05421743_105218 [Thalassobacillus cyri]